MMLCVRGRKAPMDGASERRRNTMSRLITSADLQGRSLAELQVMLHQAHCALAQTWPGSDRHRDAVAALDDIRRMIRLKQQTMAPRF